MPGQIHARNYWRDDKCAKAFWSQQEVRPYQQLLADTIAWAAPSAGEKWLDLGCGGGTLTRAIWEHSQGGVAEIVGLDCAAANGPSYDQLQAALGPSARGRIRFLCHDFSAGLELFPDDYFDHAVSGLSITYAESYSQELGRWTTEAFDRILSEARRVIRPGGRLVFSANVPDPSWLRVVALSLDDVLHSRRPLRFLKRSLRMLRYARWLKHEAKIGRFHYLPADVMIEKLVAAGFKGIEYRLSYARQAHLFRCSKPV